MYLCIYVSLYLCVCVSVYLCMYGWMHACNACIHAFMHALIALIYLYLYTRPVQWTSQSSGLRPLHPSPKCRWVCISIYLFVLVIQKKNGVPQTLCVPIQKSQPFHDVGCPIFSHSFLEYLCMVYMIHSWWSQKNPAAEVITFGCGFVWKYGTQHHPNDHVP